MSVGCRRSRPTAPAPGRRTRTPARRVPPPPPARPPPPPGSAQRWAARRARRQRERRRREGEEDAGAHGDLPVLAPSDLGISGPADRRSQTPGVCDRRPTRAPPNQVPSSLKPVENPRHAARRRRSAAVVAGAGSAQNAKSESADRPRTSAVARARDGRRARRGRPARAERGPHAGGYPVVAAPVPDGLESGDVVMLIGAGRAGDGDARRGARAAAADARGDGAPPLGVAAPLGRRTTRCCAARRPRGSPSSCADGGAAVRRGERCARPAHVRPLAALTEAL